MHDAVRPVAPADFRAAVSLIPALLQQVQQFNMWLDKTEEGRKFKDDQVKQANIASDNLREDEKFEWEKITDLMEYDLEKTQKRPAAIS